jgi:hypothetical protein
MRDARAFPIRDEWVLDEDDDRLRLAKAREDQNSLRRAEEERLMQLEEEAEVAAEERRRQIDEQDTRPRTYDRDGRIIWIKEPNPEDMPNTQELFDVELQSSPNDAKEIVPSWTTLPVKKQPPQLPNEDSAEKDPKKKRPTWLRKKTIRKLTDGEGKFTDGFYKPDHMQPPLIDTMKVTPGVILTCMGQQKYGTESSTEVNRDRRMTRKEYIRMAYQREQASRSASGGTSVDGDSRDPSKGTSPAAKSQRPSSAPGGRSRSKMERGTSNPDGNGPGYNVDGMAANRAGSKSSSKDVQVQVVMRKPLVFVGGGEEQNTREPPAPSWSVRNNGRALKGDARPPRFHVSPLGACLRQGPVQPPLGATMGHGLMRSSSTKTDFYFPSGLPSPTAGGPASSPTSGRGPPSGRSPASGRQRPMSAMGRMAGSKSVPAVPRGAAWVAASPSSTMASK